MMALVELSGEEAKFILDNIFVVEELEAALKSCAGKSGYYQVEFDCMEASLAIGDLIHLSKSIKSNEKLILIDSICQMLERAV